MIRARNEEATLAACIASLKQLTINQEIVVILHRCTDGSHDIVSKLASENKNIKVYAYEHQISRAGYETLATDVDSDHSFITFSNFCRSKCSMPWIFKWDADFIASDGLITFLNSREWKSDGTTLYMNAVNSTHKNCEAYLSCCLDKYTKHIFWEVPSYTMPNKKLLLEESIFIKHTSELKDLKQYWTEQPWYLTDVSEEAKLVKRRMELLELNYGIQPEGLARASNPVCDKFFTLITSTKPSYVNFFK